MIAIDHVMSVVWFEYEVPSHYLDLWPGVKEIESFDLDCLPATGG